MEATLPGESGDNSFSNASLLRIFRDLCKYQNAIKDKLHERDEANFDSECDSREAEIEQSQLGGDSDDESKKAQKDKAKVKRTDHAHTFSKEMLQIITNIGSFNTKLRQAVEKNGIALNKEALACEFGKKGNTFNPLSDELKDILIKVQPEEEPELVEPKDLQLVEPALITKTSNTNLHIQSMTKLVNVSKKHVLPGAEEAQLSASTGLMSYFVKDPLRDEFQVKFIDFKVKDSGDQKLGLQVQSKIKEKMTLHLGSPELAFFIQTKKQSMVFQVKDFSAKNTVVVNAPLSQYSSSTVNFKDFASEDCCFVAHEHLVAVATKTPNQQVQVTIESIEDADQRCKNIDTGLKVVNNLYIRHFEVHLIAGKPILIALDAAGSLFAQRVDEIGKTCCLKPKNDGSESLALFVQENRKTAWVLRKPKDDFHVVLDEYTINEADAKLTLKQNSGRYEFTTKMPLNKDQHIKIGMLSTSEQSTQVVLIFNSGANRMAVAQFTQGCLVGGVSECNFLRGNDSAEAIKELRLQTAQVTQGGGGKEKLVLSFTPFPVGSKKLFGLSGAIEFQLGTVTNSQSAEGVMELDS